MKNKAYSYIRFSSKRQMKGHSLKRQTELVESYCLAHDLELQDTNFQDLGVSAWSGANTNEDAGLGQFLKAVDSGKIPTGSYLLVESLDRLSRERVEVAINQLTSLINKGVVVVTLLDKRVLKAGDPNMMMELFMALSIMQRAFEESETKSKRLRAVWADKRANPDTTKRTSVCPFWLKLNEDKRTYTVLEDKAELVNKIFDLAIQGFGSLKIAKLINVEGHRTVRGKNFQEATIHLILTGKQVLGVYHPHVRVNGKRIGEREPIENYYPAIVTEEKYNLAQARLLERKKGSKGKQVSHKNIFLDLATCAKCGSNMVLTHKTTSWLTCKERLVKQCDNSPVRLEVLQEWVRTCFLQPVFFQSWIKPDNTQPLDKLEGLRAKREREEKALSELLEGTQSFSNPIILGEIQKRSESLTELSRTIEGLEGELLESESLSNIRLSLNETIKVVNAAFKEENNEETITARIALKRVLRATFDKLTVSLPHLTESCQISAQGQIGEFYYHSEPNPAKALKGRKKNEPIWFMYDLDK